MTDAVRGMAPLSGRPRSLPSRAVVRAGAPSTATGVPDRTAAARFARARDAVHALLPGWLRSVVPATALGFAAISVFTYATDLLLLTIGFDVVGLPYPVAVTIGYVVAFGLAFLLNRWLNFQSRGSVARQSGRYLLTAASNYVLFILLLSSTLEALGVQFLLARLLAGACEAVFMYLAMRLYVFRQESSGAVAGPS